MKIIVVIDSFTNKDHKEHYMSLQEACNATNNELELVDIAHWEKETTYINYIGEQDNGWLITFDMVGFEKRTITEGPSYNMLHCKMVHILFRKMHTYTYIQDRMNFSMFLFIDNIIEKQEKELLEKKYQNIPNLEKFIGYPNLLAWLSEIRL